MRPRHKPLSFVDAADKKYGHGGASDEELFWMKLALQTPRPSGLSGQRNAEGAPAHREL